MAEATKVLLTESYLTDIANAIRSKNGEAGKYLPSEMAEKILALTTGTSVVVTKGSVVMHSGTFTPVEDNALSPEIEHGMPRFPKLIYVTSDVPKQTYAVRGSLLFMAQDANWGVMAMDGRPYIGYVSVYNASSAVVGALISTEYANNIARVRATSNDERFVCVNTTNYYDYKAGVTYRWYAFDWEVDEESDG